MKRNKRPATAQLRDEHVNLPRYCGCGLPWQLCCCPCKHCGGSGFRTVSGAALSYLVSCGWCLGTGVRMQ